MKRLFIVIALIFIYTGCMSNIKKNELKPKNDFIDENNYEENKTMKFIINNKEYSVQLENNKTVDELINLLPLNLDFSELNGNEKYVYLNNVLPTNSSNPGRVNKGDIMLYGNNCLVLFYESFDTTYSYTKIGHISNLPSLGNDNIFIKIEK